MAMYKVPQDVEADDKLIGPFSFRQFIYLIIVAISIGIAWGLSRLFVPLAIIPLPIILFFGALALPLRKDQPMEIYLAAIVSFYLKPRRRLWQPDGIQSLVEITAPKTVEIQRTKDLSQAEAQQRLSYLADIVDTGGWAIRGVVEPEAPSAMRNDVYFAAQQTEDILSDDGGVSRSFDAMINNADIRRRQEVIERMRQTAPGTELVEQPVTATTQTYSPTQDTTQTHQPQVATPQPTYVDPYAAFIPAENLSVASDPRFNFNPYPNAMRQSVISPLSQQAPSSNVSSIPDSAVQTAVPRPGSTPIQAAQASTPQQPTPPQTPYQQVAAPTSPTISEKTPSPDIINLANNANLSVETIAHEANRIHNKEMNESEEVVISLR